MEGAPIQPEKVSIDRPFLAASMEAGFEIDREDILSTIGVSKDEYIEKIKSLPENERMSSLLENGVLTHPVPEKSWSYTSKRPIVFAKLNGHIIPFYRSSSGTSGKQEGKWYPFFGFGDNWLVKFDVASVENSYGIPPLQKVAAILAAVLDYNSDIDKTYMAEHYIGPDKAGILYQKRNDSNFDVSMAAGDHPVLGKKESFISPRRINQEIFNVTDEEMNIDLAKQYIEHLFLEKDLMDFLKAYKTKMNWEEFQW